MSYTDAEVILRVGWDLKKMVEGWKAYGYSTSSIQSIQMTLLNTSFTIVGQSDYACGKPSPVGK